MNKILGIIGTLTFTFTLTTWAEDTVGSEVKIPLSRYLELVEKQKTQPITVIEESSLKGDYKTSAFQITFKGQAVSPWKKEAVLESFEGHLRSCSGSAIISFQDGAYQLLPQKSNFQLTCKLQPKNKNLKLQVLNALFFESQVANAESNMNEDNTQRRLISLLEKSKETLSKPRAEVVAKAHYKLSILPDTSKFDYNLTINNPNRLSEKYQLNLSNNEIIETISTDLKYQESGSEVSFNVPTGEHSVYIKGKINGQNFKPLLKSEEQYLLIQNHPLMQVQPTTNWRRIATHESSISQEYNSARAFLIDPRESLTWSSKKLEVFSALGYTLKKAHYLYYVPRNGKAVVEATYHVSNQGTPEISLKIPGKALYVSIDGAATPLYKDDKGQLLLSMTSGEHNVVVQYQPEMPERTLATFAQSNLVKPNAVITQSSMTLRHDPAWSLIFGRFGGDFVSHLQFSSLLWAFFFGALLFFALKKLFTIQNSRILYSIAIPAGALTLFGSLYGFILMCTLGALIVWRFRAWIVARIKQAAHVQINYKKAAFILGALFIGMYLFKSVARVSSGFSRNKDFSANVETASSEAYDSYSASDVAASPMKALVGNALSKNKVSEESDKGGGASVQEMAQSGDSYEGLPAKIEIPQSGRDTYFNLSMLDADKDIRVSSFFVKNYFFMFLDMLLVLALGFALYRNRKLLREALLKSNY